MMLQAAEEQKITEYPVPLADYSALKAEALLNGLIPELIPIDLHITSDGIVQSVDLQGITDYSSAMNRFSAREVLFSLLRLCQSVIGHPVLMNEELELLAADRLFWDADSSEWRHLMIMEKSGAWASLPDHSPDEVWSALFTIAMEASEEKRIALQKIVDDLADQEFSVEGLSKALSVSLSSMAEEIPAETERSEEVNIESPEEEEYKPWETKEKLSVELELGLTGEPVAGLVRSDKLPAMKKEPQEANVQERPAQPVIPGIAPPPPPPVRTTMPEAQEAKVVGAGTATTVLLKPETSVLDNVTAPGAAGTVIGQIPVTKMKIPRVVRMETGEAAYVDRPRFLIGSKAGAVDFVVSNNRVISRRHAAIVTKGSDYYIVDLGSRNGVYVENRRISPNQETMIYVGDVFVLANEKFRLQW